MQDNGHASRLSLYNSRRKWYTVNGLIRQTVLHLGFRSKDINPEINHLPYKYNSHSGFSKALRKNEAKYAPLILDLDERGKVVSFVTLEVGTLGHLTKDALKNLSLLFPIMQNLGGPY